jgi:integrase/recombinase XerD
MVKIRLRYVVEDMDRHGNPRLYFRRKGQPKVRLPGLPGSDEFMTAYKAALSATGGGAQHRLRAAKGSFGCLCLAYYASATFKALDASTQSWRRRALDVVCERHGDKPVSLMQGKHVRMLRDELSDRPGAARNRLKALRALFRWAMEADEASHDPTRDVKAITYATKGHHTWTLEEVEAFESCHAIGSKARLAMAIMLYTTCRREDAVRLGPQHIRNGRIRYRQAKNEHRNPIDCDIPLHPDLAEVIAATPSAHLTFLVTEQGRPFTPAGFGNKFREWCNRANLPIARHTDCVKLPRLAWRNAAQRLTKSWRSPAISHWKKWNGTHARRGRHNLRTPPCRSSNDEHKVSHSPSRWDN